MKPLYTEEQFNNSKSSDKLPCECKACQKTFYKTRHQIQDALNPNLKATIDFCNKICYGSYQKINKDIFCKQCNKKIHKKPSQIKKSKSGNVFCSYSCSTTYKNTHKTKGYNRSKLEIWLESKLLEIYPDQRILFNDNTAINSELDVYFPELRLAFELNGLFHYEPIFGEEKLKKTQCNDKRKFFLCNKNKISLCIIDTSKQTYVKEKTSMKYLNIIKNIINENIKQNQ
jgi:hypothetical protein